MPVRLIECLSATEEMADLFSDQSILEAMLRFEIALARAQVRLGLIPARAAESIAAAATASTFDAADLARRARRSASPAIPFIEVLTARVREISEADAEYVHWGATSQDLIDTAFILILARARDALARDHMRLMRTLHTLSEHHADTVMLARTLLQPAQPTTFGYKVAGYYGSLRRSWRQLLAACARAIQLEFGGAAGTLAAYGTTGPALAIELGRELALLVPAAPWHVHRDQLAAVVTSCGIYAGCLGKMANDTTLLMQAEVGEASEPAGGSSAMPHKRNPAGSVVALASVARVPGLVGTYLRLMVHEHERATGTWQAEWQTIAEVLTAVGSALAAIADAFAHLDVHPDRMRANLAQTRGTVLSERFALALATTMGRTDAQALVAHAAREATESGRSMGEVIGATLAAAGVIAPDNLAALSDPTTYIGAAEVFRRRLLEDAD
jgi:3-carboxy-cis,cis-muconate cycloisomerase